jgi:hypothetical protein
VVGAVLEEDTMAATEDDGDETASREARVWRSACRQKRPA